MATTLQDLRPSICTHPSTDALFWFLTQAHERLVVTLLRHTVNSSFSLAYKLDWIDARLSVNFTVIFLSLCLIDLELFNPLQDYVIYLRVYRQRTVRGSHNHKCTLVNFKNTPQATILYTHKQHISYALSDDACTQIWAKVIIVDA